MVKLASTGRIVNDYIVANNIDIFELAKKACVSLKTVYRFLKGETKLSFNLAEALEEFIPSLKVDFLLNYDTKYQYELAKYQKENNLPNLNSIVKKYCLDELYPDETRFIQIDNAIAMFGIDNVRKLEMPLNISELNKYSKTKNLNEEKAQLWLRASLFDFMVETKGEAKRFDERKFINGFNSLKDILDVSDINSLLVNFLLFTNECGINFYVRDGFAGSQVKAGAYMDKDERVFIFVSKQFKIVQNLALTLMQECLHIKNGNLTQNEFSCLICESDSKEDNISEEAKAEFIGEDNLNKIEEAKEFEVIYEVKEDTNRSLGLVTEIYRQVKKVFKDKELNSYIDYFKEKDINLSSIEFIKNMDIKYSNQSI